jgi:hypothetical protein
LWWCYINYSHILKGVILSYPRKRLPLEGIEPTTTVKDTHKPVTIELWCYDISSTLHGHMDLIVSLHMILNFKLLLDMYWVPAIPAKAPRRFPYACLPNLVISATSGPKKVTQAVFTQFFLPF